MKNLQVTSVDAQKLYVSGVVQVDTQLDLNGTGENYLFLDGVKRANVITGGGNDTIEIRMVTYDYSAWSDDFGINTGAGDGHVHLSELDLDAALAVEENNYSIGGAKVSGLSALISSLFDIFGVGAGNKHLYKINLTTGETTAVGKIGLFKIDPNTAATTFIGGNSASYKSTEQDMAVAKDGTLYFTSESQLMKVSTTTGISPRSATRRCRRSIRGSVHRSHHGQDVRPL